MPPSNKQIHLLILTILSHSKHRIQQQLVRELLVPHAPRLDRAVLAVAPMHPPALVKHPERVHTSQTLQLGAQPGDLRAHVGLEPRVPGRQVVQGHRHRQERVLDAVRLVGPIDAPPLVEAL